jgi:hypothetical protein
MSAANTVFHNNTVSMMSTWYDSQAQLVRMACLELGQPDKCDELIEKFLGKKMKIKIQKNPYLPKKPKSAYLFFCDSKRSKLIENAKKKHPEKKIVIGDIAKELGNIWKTKTNETQKKKFEEQAAKDKERYVNEMSDYKEKYNLV